MLATLRARFIFLGFLAFTATTASSAENYITDSQTKHYANVQHIATEVIQRHMEADMMHDGIRGNVFSALYASRTANMQLLKESQQDINEMVETFSKNVKENSEATVPDNIHAQFATILKSVNNYGQAAKRIIAASNDFDAASALLPKFNETFEVLEEQQGKATDMILEWSKQVNDESNSYGEKAARLMLTLEIISILIALTVPVFAIRSIFSPLSQMINSMKAIAGGDTSAEIPHTARANEIGTMAKTVQTFKDNAQRIVQLAKEQEEAKKKADEDRKQAINTMANTFETNVKGVVDMVASAATEMDATSRSVGSIVDLSKTKLATLNHQISGTTQNVSIVASAASQLSSAVEEINQQITRATSIISSTVDEAGKADITVQSLSEAASKIGEVVEMINTIAAQINLLALNATIEAARAGDAGKGFAVVASEVKNLATQTTKATEQITQFITSIQSATGQTVSAIGNIGGRIREISEISTTIAAAVEEQSVATREIASNVQQAANGTDMVATNAAEVGRASEEAGQAAHQMIAASSELSRQSEMLRGEVDKFLSGVRA